MVDTETLMRLLNERKITQKELAAALRMSERTVNSRLQCGIFKTNEMEVLRALLKLSKAECIEIFLPKKFHGTKQK